MLNASYRKKLAASMINFDVIANGSVFHHSDFISASLVAHQTGGRLYRVLPMEGTPHGFKRFRVEPLPEDIAKSCSNRIPRKRNLEPRCVPVWR